MTVDPPEAPPGGVASVDAEPVAPVEVAVASESGDGAGETGAAVAAVAAGSQRRERREEVLRQRRSRQLVGLGLVIAVGATVGALLEA
jgi:hypothetical protein